MRPYLEGVHCMLVAVQLFCAQLLITAPCAGIHLRRVETGVFCDMESSLHF